LVIPQEARDGTQMHADARGEKIYLRPSALIGVPLAIANFPLPKVQALPRCTSSPRRRNGRKGSISPA